MKRNEASLVEAMASLTVARRILAIARQYTICAGFLTFGFGLIGNLLNILMFLKLKDFQHNKCIFYLLSESFVDLIAVVYYLTVQSLTMVYGSDLSPYVPIWCKFRAMISQSLVLFVFGVTCFAAIDQYLSTNYSAYLRQMSTLKLARYSVIGSLCFALGHSIVCGSFFDSKPPIDCVASNPIIIKYYSYFAYPFLAGLLPICVAGIASMLAFRNVRHITRQQITIVRRRLDHQLTTFVFIRVAFLILCTTPTMIQRVYAANSAVNPSDSLRIAIERLILAIAVSIQNLIYSVNVFCSVK